MDGCVSIRLSNSLTPPAARADVDRGLLNFSVMRLIDGRGLSAVPPSIE